MINFRFHLVSLVAVFLALALGIVVGSTLIDRAIVDALRNRIDTVEANLDDADATNDQLRDQRDTLDEFVEAVAPFAVQDRLAETNGVVVAARGVERDALEGVVEQLRVAGAATPGVLWFEEDWVTREDAELRSLADELGVRAAAGAASRAALLDELARELTTEGPQPVLEGLAADGLVAFEALGTETETEDDDVRVGGPVPRAVLATDADATVSDDALVVPLARAFADLQVPVTVGAVGEPDDGDDRGAGLEVFRSEPSLAASVSTVDDLDLVMGQVATTLTLAAGAEGVTGAYGIGPDADALLPVEFPSAPPVS